MNNFTLLLLLSLLTGAIRFSSLVTVCLNHFYTLFNDVNASLSLPNPWVIFFTT